MTLAQFKNAKITGRDQIQKSAVKVLSELDPVAIHQFGSGATGFRDEFSDLDLFVTLSDDQFEQLVPKRYEIFSQIAPILIRQYSTVANPAGWYHDLIIYETDKGLFHVDYYFTPRSKAILPPNSELIIGDTNIQPGTWDTWTLKGIGAPPTSTDKLESLLAMSYIGVKGLVRHWEPEFYDYVRDLYVNYQTIAKQSLPSLPPEINFDLIYSILNNLNGLGTEQQNKANRSVLQYAQEVEKLYFRSSDIQ